ncbi:MULTISPECIES: GGDEF domain-containing protein [Vibrio]|uniref:diguanylate cyclase n=1 Tax=Vibrio diazotrophicus TaxID=685 RepID=A0A2J8I7H6_VIBDI|nr:MULTISPECIES: GGDEF domain-containing protein [Vibrio]MCF7362405.1 GGDEF domain-containing protein [Vibrio sp. A1-b2]MCZ4371692.1 GGDEF domain-containing protein [Vibrio diazotrophicus]PNI06468.1 GGDEF domain-containing protein [Vibrio diazotrophicus]
MEALLNKVQEAGLDATSVSGEEAVAFWGKVRRTIASTKEEKALCFIVSAEFHAEMRQIQNSISELRSALNLLDSNNAELILSVKNSLAELLIENGDYVEALQEHISSSGLAVEYRYIDDYVLAILGMGNLCDAYGDHRRAMSYYLKIDSLDHAISSRSLRLRYKLYMLACYVSLGRFDEADELVQECEELSILVSDKILAGQTILYEAKIYRHQGEIEQALRTLSMIQFSPGNIHSYWLANMVRVERAKCFLELGKPELSNMLLFGTEKRLKRFPSPVLEKGLYKTFSRIFERQGLYKEALRYEREAFDIESELIQKIPIAELGATQLRRLSRFELQLKLIVSELENQELKETTEHHKNAVARLQQDVLTDPLTKLHNRRWLDGKLKELLHNETPFAFLVVDIDHFKSINDELSHLVGDKAIVNVSSELAEHFNFPQASCVRYGGEEFLVILENMTLEQAQAAAEAFRERIFKYHWQDILGERGLTVSIGITLNKEGENTQRTFYRADKALYRAKANGRNQVCSE